MEFSANVLRNWVPVDGDEWEDYQPNRGKNKTRKVRAKELRAIKVVQDAGMDVTLANRTMPVVTIAE